MATVHTIKYWLSKDNIELKSGKRPHKGPLLHGYKPELDVTDEFDEHVFQWKVELGRIGIQIDFALLFQYQASPRESHLEALYLIFKFLSGNPKKILVIDSSVTKVENSVFNLNNDWKEFYGDVVEDDPNIMPKPLGNQLYVGCFVD